MVQVYLLVIVALAIVYAVVADRPAYHTVGLTIFCGWAIRTGWIEYLALRRIVEGLDWITIGLAFFALATLISFKKAGLCSKLGEARLKKRLSRSTSGLD